MTQSTSNDLEKLEIKVVKSNSDWNVNCPLIMTKYERQELVRDDGNRICWFKMCFIDLTHAIAWMKHISSLPELSKATITFEDETELVDYRDDVAMIAFILRNS